MFDVYSELDLNKRVEVDKILCEDCGDIFWSPIFDRQQFKLCEPCFINRMKEQEGPDTEKEIEKIGRIFNVANMKVN